MNKAPKVLEKTTDEASNRPNDPTDQRAEWSEGAAKLRTECGERDRRTGHNKVGGGPQHRWTQRNDCGGDRNEFVDGTGIVLRRIGPLTVAGNMNCAMIDDALVGGTGSSRSSPL